MTKDELLCAGIKAERHDILYDIAKLREQLEGFQEICPHVNATKDYFCSSGNYDPSRDCQWYTYNCPDCGKRWTEEL